MVNNIACVIGIRFGNRDVPILCETMYQMRLRGKLHETPLGCTEAFITSIESSMEAV